MRIVEFGVIIVLFVGFLIALGTMLYGLMGWTFVHDKLRKERKLDEKEKNGG